MSRLELTISKISDFGEKKNSRINVFIQILSIV